MDIKAYIYVETGDETTLCFKCAVKNIIAGDEGEFNLALGEGDTGSGQDMRSPPKCMECDRYLRDFCIA